MAAAAGPGGAQPAAVGGKLIFIERNHPAVPEAVRRLVTGENHVANSAIRDFDGNEYFIDFADDGATLTISIRHSIPASFFAKYADYRNELSALLQRRFSGANMTGVRIFPEPLKNMTATIGVDTSVLMQDVAAVPSLPALREASAMRLFCVQAVFNVAFDKFLKCQTSPTTATTFPATKIPYRRAGEGGGAFDESLFVYVHAANFNITINVSVPDVDDRLFAKAFLQTFADARKLEKSLGSAPSFLYSAESAPAAFSTAGFPEAGSSSPDMLWATFVLSRKSMEPAKAEATVLQLMNFRTYLFYHIQTCRSYMHSKMRERMASAMQVLNRAKTKATGKARIQID